MTSNRETPPLTAEQTKAFEDILAVFSTPGWKHLHSRLVTDLRTVENIRNCKDLAFSSGQVAVLDAIVRWPETWAALYDAAQIGDVEIQEDAFR